MKAHRFLWIGGIFLLSSLNIAAQEDWKEASTNRGKIEVRYRISQRIDEYGEEVPLIEYTARTVEQVSFEDCIALMKDISRHKDFLDAESSHIISSHSDSRWTTYYVYPAGGPIEASDAVMDFRYLESDDGKTATFTFNAAPDEFPHCGMARASYDHEVFQFRDLGNGQVEISVEMQVSPAMDVPQWMLKLAFPTAGGDVIQNILQLVN